MTPSIRKQVFETLYKNHYLYRFASTVPFAGQWRTWQRQVLSRLVGHDILELGCGLGDLLADIGEAGYNCRAVEHSPQMVAAARETLQRRKVGDKSWVLQGTAQHLSFEKSSFDTVVSTFPSEYIYDPETMAGIERVLRPDGRVIVIEGANLLPVGFFQPFLLFFQMFIYGPAALFGRRSRSAPHSDADAQKQTSDPDQKYPQEHPEEKIVRINRNTGAETTTQVLENAWFGQRIPLEQHGLLRRSELVRSRRWEVYITIGEKRVVTPFLVNSSQNSSLSFAASGARRKPASYVAGRE